MSETQRKQATAQAVGDFMARRDGMILGMGARLIEVGPGRCVLQATIKESMLNAMGMGHGGAVFGLADAAFAIACNSHNRVHVAQTCTISFLHPTTLGDVLTVTAIETLREDKSGICDIAIVNQQGKTVAVFRGQSRGVAGHVLPDPS